MLNNNDFRFGDNIYLQTSGTAMGIPFAPDYANNCCAKVEVPFLQRMKEIGLEPLIWLRFIDDVFCLWQHKIEDWHYFHSELNKAHPSFSFTGTINSQSVDFLDVTIYKGPRMADNYLDTKVYTKPTDTHQLLETTSSHPKHTFKGIVKSQIMRYHRISTQVSDFDNSCSTLFKALKQRGYNGRKLRKSKADTLRDISKKMEPSRPMPKHIDHVMGSSSSQCNRKNCKCCSFIQTSQTFTDQLGNWHLVNNDMTCESKHLIYLLRCNKCNLDYIGQTGMSLAERLSDHRSRIKLKKDTPVANHFSTNHNIPKDLTIQPIEKLKDHGNPKINLHQRLIREHWWIKEIQSSDPKGINLIDHETYPCPDFGIIPMIIPWSTTGNQLAKNIKMIYTHLAENHSFCFHQNLITAFSRNKNIKDRLVKSKMQH